MTAPPRIHATVMTHPRLIDFGPQVPRRGNALSRGLGLLLLRLIGWRVRGQFPDTPKAVVIIAPHTSNYDGVVVVAALLALGLRLSFFVKHTAFRWPVAGLMRWFGALPVNREDSHNLVAFTAGKFREKEQLLLAMAPEGTRHAAESWKSGFYWMAREAGVPIICAGFDYARRELVILHTLMPSGDLDAELPAIIARYRDMAPCRPERLSAPLRALQQRQ